MRPACERIAGEAFKRVLLRNAWRAVGPAQRTDVLARCLDEWFFERRERRAEAAAGEGEADPRVPLARRRRLRRACGRAARDGPEAGADGRRVEIGASRHVYPPEPVVGTAVRP